jgi:hypothetical protein
MFVKEGCFKTSSTIAFFVSGKSKMSARLPRANARSTSTSKILERDLNRLYCAREPASFSRILPRHFQLEAKVPRLLKFGRSTLEPIIIFFLDLHRSISSFMQHHHQRNIKELFFLLFAYCSFASSSLSQKVLRIFCLFTLSRICPQHNHHHDSILGCHCLLGHVGQWIRSCLIPATTWCSAKGFGIFDIIDCPSSCRDQSGGCQQWRKTNRRQGHQDLQPCLQRNTQGVGRSQDWIAKTGRRHWSFLRPRPFLRRDFGQEREILCGHGMP